MIILISFISLLASLLTFFSGFGLGTILTPVFALYFDLKMAIAMTAVVHLLNNLFKFVLVRKYFEKKIILSFGIPAMIFAFVGSWLLNILPHTKIIIGGLIIIFTILELTPGFNKLALDKKYLKFGGILSGFFGGLSGHQGALRTLFLKKLNLSKESFIATGVAIACLIDFSRLIVYKKTISITEFSNNYQLIFAATFSAFIGAYVGNKLLKKITINWLQYFISAALIIFGITMILGWI